MGPLGSGSTSILRESYYAPDGEAASGLIESQNKSSSQITTQPASTGVLPIFAGGYPNYLLLYSQSSLLFPSCLYFETIMAEL